MITIIDIGMGNLGSIRNMLKHVGVDSVVTSDAAEIESAEKLILPGVGAFDNAMESLKARELLGVLNKKAKSGTPILGVCLGMQLLSKRSEEGKFSGLGWIDAETIRFKLGNGFRIPHMGWNTVEANDDSDLFKNMPAEPRFYFVHSYHVACKDKGDVLATTNYGIDFASAVRHKNVYGVQFHPEKSHRFGMQLYKNFAELV